MNDKNITDEDNEKWVDAFHWWYQSSCLDNDPAFDNLRDTFPLSNIGEATVFSNLRQGVPLSVKNGKFLVAILDGSVKPLSGKQTALAQARKYAADWKIWNLHAAKTPQRQMLEILKSDGLVEKKFTLSALQQRIYRRRKDPIQKCFETQDKFEALYADITK